MDRSGHSILHFSPYALDLTDEVLLHNSEVVPLRRKTFGVLSVLVQQRGQLVTTGALMDLVWVNVVVSPPFPSMPIPGVIVAFLSKAPKSQR